MSFRASGTVVAVAAAADDVCLSQRAAMSRALPPSRTLSLSLASESSLYSESSLSHSGGACVRDDRLVCTAGSAPLGAAAATSLSLIHTLPRCAPLLPSVLPP